MACVPSSTAAWRARVAAPASPARRGLRLLQRDGLPGALHTAGERVGGRRQIALGGRCRRVGMLRLVLVPFGLPTLQVLRVLGERRQLALERGALEQLLAPLELTPQLLLRLGEALEGLSGRLGIEPRERFLQLAQPLLDLGRQRPLPQL